MTNATPRSCETCEDDGGSELAAMKLLCGTLKALCRQVARTDRRRGVSRDENKTDLDQKMFAATKRVYTSLSFLRLVAGAPL